MNTTTRKEWNAALEAVSFASSNLETTKAQKEAALELARRAPSKAAANRAYDLAGRLQDRIEFLTICELDAKLRAEGKPGCIRTVLS